MILFSIFFFQILMYIFILKFGKGCREDVCHVIIFLHYNESLELRWIGLHLMLRDQDLIGLDLTIQLALTSDV